MPSRKEPRNDLTAQFIRSILHYDPDTGIFVWLRAVKGHAAGRVAGTQMPRGEIYIGIRSEKYGRPHRYLAHRLAWLYVTGRWPEGELDHRDTNPGNNRFLNLREATTGQNQRNIRHRADSAQLYKGIERKSRKWKARITFDGRRIALGSFGTPEEAHAAYCAASVKYHGEFGRFE